MTNHPPNLICTVCGKAYWRQTTRIKSSRYCSRACKQLGQENPLTKESLSKLYYDQKWSMQQIANHYSCSVNKVVYWMNTYHLERRDWSEATYAYKNPDGDPFRIRLPETVEEEKLFALAIGLYLGEGTKKGIHNVAMVNSDPRVLRIFINFLERFCGIARKELHAGLNIFSDCDVEAAIQWWALSLGLEVKQFYVPTVREAKSDYSKKSEYGTLSLTFSNIKLLEIIKRWCNEYAERFAL